MDYDDLVRLRREHAAWRLLAADSAPLVAAFLHHAFIAPNVRTHGEQELAGQLDDFLHRLRERRGDDPHPKTGLDYLNDWSSDERGWLRRYFPPDSDEPHYDLTPAAEQAIQWLAGLEDRAFIGAESRLKVVFDLLREIVHGSETDPQSRIEELERRRAAIDAEIEAVRAGWIELMDATQLRERFLQARETAYGLLADFRQVEQNFRDLDRRVRERIAGWEGSRAEVLDEVFGQRDAIADSDQGRSFQAFWDFLMSARHQEELGRLLEQVLALEPVAELAPDPRLRRVHYDWMAAGEVTQRTVARLSEQLRRYLDDQAWLENRRIMEILHSLERNAMAVRERLPAELVALDEPSPRVELPLDRPLFTPPPRAQLASGDIDAGDADLDPAALFEQVYVDRERLRARLRRALQTRRSVTLPDLLAEYPLEQGLAELVAWLSLATGEELGVIDEDREQSVEWTDAEGRQRRATLPAVIFTGTGGTT
jgi:flagellar motility protein MotE (MotC chaperone)